MVGAPALTAVVVVLTFTENPDGSYAPPSGRRDTLVHNGDGTWTLTLQHSRTAWLFSATGALTSITDEYGNVQSWSYDAQGRVQRLTDVTTGRYVDVFYGADGRISGVQDNAARSVTYAYTNGFLTTVTDPAGRATHYAPVDGRFGPLLAEVEDEWGRTVSTMTYDATDRLTSYTEHGETYTFDYSLVAQNKTIKRDSQLNTWELTSNASGNVTDRLLPGGATLHKEFNADGTTSLSRDEAGVETRYTYDAQGRVATVWRDALHNGPRTDYTYDASFPDKVSTVTVMNPVTNLRDPAWQAWQYDTYQAGDPAPGALHHVYRVQTDGVTLDTVATYR